ncbi:hypothetical protein [Salinisphaera aquimarina]|uniref:Uncharacterized protein n=1 Tax=Salinisphaera aquimarina TaxID=2094031 RepID=A0ABV7EPI7_9GAMM
MPRDLFDGAEFVLCPVPSWSMQTVGMLIARRRGVLVFTDAPAPPGRDRFMADDYCSDSASIECSGFNTGNSAG